MKYLQNELNLVRSRQMQLGILLNYFSIWFVHLTGHVSIYILGHFQDVEHC